MSVVVGFNWPVDHDQSAVAIVDGRLVFASEEERYTRHKRSFGEPPYYSLISLLKYLGKFGIKARDIDTFAVNYDVRLMSKPMSDFFFRKCLGQTYNTGSNPLWLNTQRNMNHMKLIRFFLRNVFLALKQDLPEKLAVVPVEHHLAHAASAYYFSGYSSCAVITVDGVGERISTAVWRVSNGNFEKLLGMPVANGSLGYFYGAMARRLSFTFLEGPGKLMGLAPYGKLNIRTHAKFENAIKINPDKDTPFSFLTSSNMEIRRFSPKTFLETDALYDRFTSTLVSNQLKWNPRGELDRTVSNTAWSTQKITEDAMLSLARWTKANTGENKLAMAGGVALNAKANMEMYYSHIFDDIFVFPAADDSGSTAGAAAYVYEHSLGGRIKNIRLRNVYLGPEYEDEEIRKLVNESRLKAEYIGDAVDPVARMLTQGKIIGWYQGRGEFGRRALGNRSIVADPRNKKMWHEVNMIKGREWWRPVAPSLLENSMNNYFVTPKEHPFMIMMYRFTVEGAKRIAAVCHVDETTRPQTVRKADNKQWYNLIKSFGERTGENILINTSFNLDGEPIVETPKDAIKTFAIGGLDGLYLQGWLITKN